MTNATTNSHGPIFSAPEFWRTLTAYAEAVMTSSRIKDIQAAGIQVSMSSFIEAVAQRETDFYTVLATVGAEAERDFADRRATSEAFGIDPGDPFTDALDPFLVVVGAKVMQQVISESALITDSQKVAAGAVLQFAEIFATREWGNLAPQNTDLPAFADPSTVNDSVVDVLRAQPVLSL